MTRSTLLKTCFALALTVVSGIALLTTTAEPAEALALCPLYTCSSHVGYVWDGKCDILDLKRCDRYRLAIPCPDVPLYCRANCVDI